MEIVFLNIYSGLVERGAERSTHELANRLGKSHEVCLIQAGKKIPQKANYKIRIIPTFFSPAPDSSFSFWRKFFLDIWSLLILFFTIRAIFYLGRSDFDIIVPLNGGWQTVLCRLFSWFKKKKMMVIGRAGIGRDDLWNLLWFPDVFVALTREAFSWAKRINARVKIVYIPNGIDLDEFKPDGLKAKISLQKPIILCVGALTKNKRINLTIQAVSLIKNCQLLILGAGPLKKNLEKEGESLLGKDRFMIRSVPAFEMPRYYRSAQVFTLASFKGEAFGNVYLEAMASNLPVVATFDPKRQEIIGKAGILVDPENTKEYAKSLGEVLSRDYHDLPRKQAEKFSWEIIIQKYEKLLATL